MNIEELNTALAQIFASDDLLINEPMSKHTTFRCGGPARFFVRASNAADITAAINAAEKADTPWWIVGCGSDLLVSDAGLPGVVIEIGERMAHIPSMSPLFEYKPEPPTKQLRKRHSKRDLQFTSLPAESQVLLVERQS